jgi:hypothetical protein
MLSCSDVDASSTPMARFTTPVIAYACMVGDEFFMPLATESEVAAAGLTCSPAFLVRIVQSCIGDGTLRVYLKDFVAQQHGTNRTLSFSRELISRTLCFINAHKECKGVLQMISVQVHSHFSSLKLKLERAADLALLVQQDLQLLQQDEALKRQRQQQLELVQGQGCESQQQRQQQQRQEEGLVLARLGLQQQPARKLARDI